jgi:hypothetical protein
MVRVAGRGEVGCAASDAEGKSRTIANPIQQVRTSIIEVQHGARLPGNYVAWCNQDVQLEVIHILQG